MFGVHLVQLYIMARYMAGGVHTNTNVTFFFIKKTIGLYRDQKRRADILGTVIRRL